MEVTVWVTIAPDKVTTCVFTVGLGVTVCTLVVNSVLGDALDVVEMESVEEVDDVAAIGTTAAVDEL